MFLKSGFASEDPFKGFSLPLPAGSRGLFPSNFVLETECQKVHFLVLRLK